MITGELLRQLLDEALRLPLHLLGLDVDRAALLVVELAVRPDLLNVRGEFTDRLVLIRLKLVFNGGKIHRPFDDRRVVPELQRLPRHWLEERLRVRVLTKLGQQEQQLVALLLAEAGEQLRRGRDSRNGGYFRHRLLHLTNLIVSYSVGHVGCDWRFDRAICLNGD